MQNIASTGRGSFRSGSGADKYMRMLVLGCGGSVGLYYWAKDSESAFWSKVVMPVYARASMDEEWCHAKAVAWLRKGKGPFDYSLNSEVLSTDALGKTLGHPLMLGAGLDRNGECVYGCLGLGFSGVEVGSVTPEKQAGNGLPRIFRIRSDETTISRAGSPNRGMAVVSYFLEQYRTWQLMDTNRHRNTLVGVNVTRNKVSTDILDDAKIGVKVLSDVADYIAINLPTPRLLGDDCIKSKAWLEDLVDSCNKARNRLDEKNRKPILFKVCLDMTEKDKKILKEVATEKKIDGLIVGQGTLARPGMMEFHFLSRQNGLAYGRPTRDMSTALVRELYEGTNGKVTIVGGGGISSGEEALEKIEAGATLLQMHSALVFHGPGVVPKIKRSLALLLEEKGYDTVNQAVGAATSLRAA